MFLDNRRMATARFKDFWDTALPKPNEGDLVAQLTFPLADGKKGQYTLMPERKAFLADGMLELEFLSFTTLDSTQLFAPQGRELYLKWLPSKTEVTLKAVTAVTFAASAKPATIDLDLQCSATQVVVQAGGKGSVEITLNLGETKDAYVIVKGASATSTTVEVIEAHKTMTGVFKVLSSGRATFDLTNLAGGSELSFYLATKLSDPEQQMRQGLPVSKLLLPTVAAGK